MEMGFDLDQTWRDEQRVHRSAGLQECRRHNVAGLHISDSLAVMQRVVNRHYQQGVDMYLGYMNVFGAMGVQFADAGCTESNTASLAASELHLIGNKQTVIDAFATLKEPGGDG